VGLQGTGDVGSEGAADLSQEGYARAEVEAYNTNGACDGDRGGGAEGSGNDRTTTRTERPGAPGVGAAPAPLDPAAQAAVPSAPLPPPLPPPLLVLELFAMGWRFGLAAGDSLGKTRLRNYDAEGLGFLWEADHGLLPEHFLK